MGLRKFGSAQRVLRSAFPKVRERVEDGSIRVRGPLATVFPNLALSGLIVNERPRERAKGWAGGADGGRDRPWVMAAGAAAGSRKVRGSRRSVVESSCPGRRKWYRQRPPVLPVSVSAQPAS